MEQKRKQETFLVQNLFYNAQEDFLVCPAGQKLTLLKQAERTSTNGYVAQVSIYQAQRCEDDPCGDNAIRQREIEQLKLIIG